MDNIQHRLIRNSAAVGTKCFLRLLDAGGHPQEYTYHEVLGWSAVWLGNYLSLDLRKNDRIVVILRHSLDLYAAYTGAILGGFVPAMFAFPSEKHSEKEYRKTFSKLLANAMPTAVVLFDELAEKLTSEIKDVSDSIRIYTPSSLRSVDVSESLRSIADPEPDETAFIQYSSGTTGIKKGVEISHQALLRQVDAYARSIHLNQKDQIVSWLPLYHDMGLISCYFLPLISSRSLTAMSAFDWVKRPIMLLEAITQYKGTLCWLPNFAYRFLDKNVSRRELKELDLSSMRGFVNCSEPVMAQSHKTFLKKFMACGLKPEALASSYAMAENTFAVTSGGFDHEPSYVYVNQKVFTEEDKAVAVSPIHPDAQLMVSSGRAMENTHIQIVSKEGQSLGEGSIGEIAFTSPSMFRGYYKNPEKTRESLRDGVFYTGDLGFVLNGQLFVTGRKKDMIIIAGKNIYPQDIEFLVNEVDGVVPGRCVALGISQEDKGTEELVILAESVETDQVRLEKIRKTIYETISNSTDVVPSDIRLVEKRWLIKSTSGKLSRAANQKKYLELLENEKAEMKSAVSQPDILELDDVTQTVLKCVRNTLKNKPGKRAFQKGDKLITSGLLDSLSLVDLIAELENVFDIQISAKYLDFACFDNVESIVGIVESIRKGASGSTFSQKTGQESNSRSSRRIISEIPAESENPAIQRTDETYRQMRSRDFRQSCPGINAVILGSSRTNRMPARFLCRLGVPAFNFSVNSSGPEDWYCILRYLLEFNRKQLKVIVLGIDGDDFSSVRKIDRRLLECEVLGKYLRPQEQAQNTHALPDKAGKRKESLLEWFQTGKKANQKTNIVTDRQTGDLPYEPRRETVDKTEYFSARMNNFHGFSQSKIEYFNAFLSLCSEHDIKVVSFLTPLYRSLYQFAQKHTLYMQRVTELKCYLEAIKFDNFCFYYTPTVDCFEGDEEGFIDSLHLDSDNSLCLLKFLLNQKKDWIVPLESSIRLKDYDLSLVQAG